MNIISFAEPLRSRFLAAYLLATVLLLAEFGGFSLWGDTLREFPFLLPLTAVTIAAFFGGTGPAAFVAIASEPYLQYYVIAPTHSFALQWPKGYVGLAFYLGLCAIVIALMHAMFASQTLLRRLNEQLEQMVAARTAGLLEAQAELQATNHNLEGLVEARAGELRVANEEVQRFAYIVSHDLRAPLVNVLGFTSELDALRGELAAFLERVRAGSPAMVTAGLSEAIEIDMPEALGFIRSSTQKMDRLIGAILKLSREGKRRLTPEPIDLDALVAAQRASLAQQLSARNATLLVPDGLPPLVSDRLAIEQIFGNLIENAVKYLSLDRTGRIVVTGRAEGSSLIYEIADNGRGISATDFERVFELFRRSGEQDTTGEGIGLAYVRDLARRLGGNVALRSALGVGSTFSVTLPSRFRSQTGEDDRG